MTFAIIFDSVGVGEWCVLLAVVLIVVGPKRLPATARKFGQYYSKFRRAADAFKRQLLEMDSEFTNSITEAKQEFDRAASDIEKTVNEATSDLTDGVSSPASDDSYNDYSDYGEYDPEREYGSGEPTEAAESVAEAKPAPAPAKKPDPAGIKITVSPAPTTAADAGRKA